MTCIYSKPVTHFLLTMRGRSGVQELCRVRLSESNEASVASLRSALPAKSCSFVAVELQEVQEEDSPLGRLSKDQVNQLRGELKQAMEPPCSDFFVQELSHRFDDGIPSQGGPPALHQAASP